MPPNDTASSSRGSFVIGGSPSLVSQGSTPSAPKESQTNAWITEEREIRRRWRPGRIELPSESPGHGRRGVTPEILPDSRPPSPRAWTALNRVNPLWAFRIPKQNSSNARCICPTTANCTHPHGAECAGPIGTKCPHSHDAECLCPIGPDCPHIPARRKDCRPYAPNYYADPRRSNGGSGRRPMRRYVG